MGQTAVRATKRVMGGGPDGGLDVKSGGRAEDRPDERLEDRLAADETANGRPDGRLEADEAANGRPDGRLAADEAANAKRPCTAQEARPLKEELAGFKSLPDSQRIRAGFALREALERKPEKTQNPRKP